MTWWWQRIGADGEPIPDSGERPEFPSRSDAESWLGEAWAELADAGVTAVTLYDGEQAVYGPMSLSAE